MKILVVSQYFWPENFRINDLVKEWLGRGHEVTVLTGKPNYPGGQVFPEFASDPTTFGHFEGAKIHRVPMLTRSQGALRLVLNYLSFVLGACIWGPWHLRGDRFDVVFVFEPSPITVGIPAVLLGKLKRAPVVLWVLDLWPETLAAVGVVRSPHLLRLVGHLVSFIYNRCALVLGQSRAFLGSIARYCRDGSKIRYFPSWAENLFQQTDVPKAPEVPEAENIFTIVFAGNVGDAQDFPAILDAAERLRDHDGVRWLIVGDGRRSAWVRDEVVRRRLGHRVFLIGRFPVERMPSFYAHADALIASLKPDPTFSMTIPGKVQSYLLAGKPILGMLDGEGAAAIESAGAGLVCPAGDARGLARAVEKMAAMTPAERHAMGARGRQFAEQEFDRARLMDRLLDFFAEVSPADAPRRGPR
ncbi:glycosyltransferase family 4 protein [Hydrogenophaga sp. BPS33]|uniref:glycosyltransferase family 4 protein n=1 Tax=Hydrogenophaga sp. BPS33 TaxID=2651974 RepID=UPI00131F8B23|nr:glycosyltransferase family 4 protein [Hydrogenophaga sp. BPS33]QHE83753.1 glycosyltransferase family 4 protein [Hydrogenophaga sp. BPS33]